MSNSATRKGGATLFLTTLMRVRLPTGRIALFQRVDFADVQTDGGKELQRLAAGGGFGIAEHNTDFFAELIDKNNACAGFSDNAGKLAPMPGS